MPQIEQDIVIDVPVERVWAVMGERFGDIAAWAGSVHASRMIAPEVRECETILGTVRERLLAFDGDARCLEYEATKAPRWFRRATNRWCVDDLGSGRSRVRIHARIALKPVYGHVMMILSAPRMRALSTSLADLKHYVETGEPHPRTVGARHGARGVPLAPSDARDVPTALTGGGSAAPDRADLARAARQRIEDRE